MPNYTYICSDHPAHTKEVIHSIGEDPEVLCSECGKQMHRKPQVFRWYRDPKIVLLDHMDDKYRQYRVKKERQKRYANARRTT